MSLTTIHGAVFTAHRRAIAGPERLKSIQVTARRNRDWLDQYEGRWPDHATGLPTPRPTWLIAQLYGVAERTVQVGILEAKRLREALHECLEAD